MNSFNKDSIAHSNDSSKESIIGYDTVSTHNVLRDTIEKNKPVQVYAKMPRDYKRFGMFQEITELLAMKYDLDVPKTGLMLYEYLNTTDRKAKREMEIYLKLNGILTYSLESNSSLSKESYTETIERISKKFDVSKSKVLGLIIDFRSWSQNCDSSSEW
jgi:hypothetical protein